MPHLEEQPQHFIKSALEKSIHRHSKKFNTSYGTAGGGQLGSVKYKKREKKFDPEAHNRKADAMRKAKSGSIDKKEVGAIKKALDKAAED